MLTKTIALMCLASFIGSVLGGMTGIWLLEIEERKEKEEYEEMVRKLP